MFKKLLTQFNPVKYVKYLVEILAVVGILALIYFGVKMVNNGIYVNMSSAAVVLQLQQLDRYETTAFTIEKIIDAGTTTDNALTQFLFGDKLLLIAHGQVIAGFDFSKLTNNSVQISGKTVTLDLPAPQILISTLDESQTRVYDRSTGILTKGDKDLESQARVAAVASIKSAACQENILADAAKNGRTQLTALLKALGFTTVIINIPNASC